MATFLAPTRSVLTGTLLGLLTLPGAFLLRAMPVQWDLLDFRTLGDLVLGALLGVPIQIFDTVTVSAYAARSEGFLGFPSLAELAFALCANVLFFYLLACGVTWYRARSGRKRPRVQTAPPGSDPRE